MPCVIRDLFIQRSNFRFSATGYFRMQLQDIRFVPIFRSDGTMIDYLQSFIVARWEDETIPAKPGEYRNIPATREETFVKTDGKLCKMIIEFNVAVAERLYFGQLPIEEVSGLSDDQTGDLFTTAFTTEMISFANVEKSWSLINSIDQLSVKPVLVLTVRSMPSRFDGSEEPPAH
jgi:hypothetical protein